MCDDIINCHAKCCDKQSESADCIENAKKAIKNNVDFVSEQYADAIEFLKKFDLTYHDVPRAMHLALLLKGRRFWNRVFSNAVNTSEAFRGPTLTRARDRLGDRSVHAEARAAYRAQVRDNDHSKRARRKTMRQAVMMADGILVCRRSHQGEFCYSLPCEKCVQVLASCKIRFVIYSTGDESRPWKKISLQKLLTDSRVMPVRALR